MVTERDGSDLQVPDLRLEALDALVLEVLQPLHPSVAGCLEAREKLEAGNVEGAIAVLNHVCPELIQDGKYRFKLVKQKFVELCSCGADSTAIACAREELAPLALDAYPEAYGEFKTCLQLLVYTKAIQRQQHEHIKDICSTAARKELAASVYHAAMQMIGIQAPSLIRILTYLLRVHEVHRVSVAQADAREQELMDQLLLRTKDAAPLPCETGLTSFREADIQALILCAGCSRREATEAIKRARGDVQAAFCHELSRLRLDGALLDGLVSEYVSFRGLATSGCSEPASESWLRLAVAPPAEPDPAPSPLDPMDLACPGQDAPASDSAPCWHMADAPGTAADTADAVGAASSSSQPRGYGCPPPPAATPKWAAPWSVRQHLLVQHPERSISQSPPAKVPRCQGTHSLQTPSQMQLASSDRRRQELPLLIAELAKGGQVQEIIQLLSEVDAEFFDSHAELLFELKRCQFLQLLEAGKTGKALAHARSELAPAAAAHEALQPALRAAMAALLGGGGRGAAAAALQQAVSGLQAALRVRMGVRGPQLVKLLQVLLGKHRAWVRREKFSDPFQGPLKLDTLREPTNGHVRHVGAGAAASLPATEHSSLPDPVSSSDPDDDELGLDEERILRLMEVLEINRSSAFDLLLQHEGDVEAAIMSSLT